DRGHADLLTGIGLLFLTASRGVVMSRETRICQSFAGLALVASFFYAGTSFSQELTTGTIVGVVHDASGRSIPDAQGSITNVATGAGRNIRTGDTGEFSAPGLPPAFYEIRVEKQGFRAYVAQNQELRINQVLRLTIPLSVGTVTETVTVTGQAGQLETDTAA